MPSHETTRQLPALLYACCEPPLRKHDTISVSTTVSFTSALHSASLLTSRRAHSTLTGLEDCPIMKGCSTHLDMARTASFLFSNTTKP